VRFNLCIPAISLPNYLCFPADDFFLNEASPKRLKKLLKKKLVELYELTGQLESADSLKKSEIIDAIINARDDVPLVPPSSTGRTGASSEYLSSDDGNVAGDETDAPDQPSPNGRQVIRRATMLDISKLTPRPRNVKGRSASMGNILGHGESSNSLPQVAKFLEKPRYVRIRQTQCNVLTKIGFQAESIRTAISDRQCESLFWHTTSSHSSKISADLWIPP
jgi:hypothetical protein